MKFQNERIYQMYAEPLQKMLYEFSGLSFEVIYPKEKVVKYNDEAEGLKICSTIYEYEVVKFNT